jgi:hypothetical protein
MKIIIVVLLVLVGVGMITLAPVANVYVSSIGFQTHESVWTTAYAGTVATTNFARLMYVAGVVLIVSGLAMGLRQRTQNVN